MDIPLYLAMTSDDIMKKSTLPPKIAWMSVRFDKEGDGLINFPAEKYDSCILILDDYNPYTRHDHKKICQQLQEHISTRKYDGILLDFQQPKDSGLCTLVRQLERELPIKVGVTPSYSTNESIVFLPPLPPAVSVESYLKPWSSHEIWLDLTTQGYSLCVTSAGVGECTKKHESIPFYNEKLCTHYVSEVSSESIIFSLQRTADDCMTILRKANAFNVRAAFSLYHELGK